MIKQKNIIITTPHYIFLFLKYSFDGWIYLGDLKDQVFLIPSRYQESDLTLIKEIKKEFPNYLIFKQKKFLSYISQNKKTIFLDENAPLKDFFIIKKYIPEIKKIKPDYQIEKDDFKDVKKVFHSLEMSLIYSYSFIKERLSMSEIVYEVRDYLYLKNPQLSRARVEVNFFDENGANKKNREGEKLSNNNYITYDLTIKVGRISLPFYKTIFFSFDKKNILDEFVKGINLLSELRKKIVDKKLNDQEVNFLDVLDSKENKNWRFLIKDVFNEKNFLPLTKKNNIKNNTLYVIKVFNPEYSFILFDVFLVEKSNITFLNTYSDQKLNFPW